MRRVLASLPLVFALVSSAHAQRQMERLDRGVVAVNQGDGRVVRQLADVRRRTATTWRSISTARSEGGQPSRLNDAPLDKVTWFVDEHAPLDKPTSYYVAP